MHFMGTISKQVYMLGMGTWMELDVLTLVKMPRGCFFGIKRCLKVHLDLNVRNGLSKSIRNKVTRKQAKIQKNTKTKEI